MKQQDKKNCLVMWVPAYWSFLRSFYNSGFSHYGGTGWSRTTVLGFSDRRANRVRHRPIFSLPMLLTRRMKKRLLELNQLHIV